MLKRLTFLMGTLVAVNVMGIRADAQPSGTPVLWLDASDASTIQDSAGVNPGGGGFNPADIQQWSDKSDSGYVFQGGIGGKAAPGFDTNPTWNGSSQNGLPGIEFRRLNGLQDAGNPAGLPVGADARRVFFAGRAADTAGTGGGIHQYFSYGANSTNGDWNNMFFFDGGGSSTAFRNYFSGKNLDLVSPNADSVTAGTPVIIEFSYDGDKQGEWYINGVLDSTPTIDTPLITTLTTVRVGREGGQQSDVDILELLVYNEANNGTADREATGYYLSNKWGIPTAYTPEPSSLLLLMLGGAAMLLRRQRG